MKKKTKQKMLCKLDARAQFFIKYLYADFKRIYKIVSYFFFSF